MVVTLTNLSLCFFAADVQCFGRDCYPVVFAINAVLIIMATGKCVVEKYRCIGRELTGLSPFPIRDAAYEYFSHSLGNEKD